MSRRDFDTFFFGTAIFCFSRYSHRPPDAARVSYRKCPAATSPARSSLKNVSLPMEFPRKVSEGVRRLRGLPLPPFSPRSGCVEISGIRIEPFRKKLHQKFTQVKASSRKELWTARFEFFIGDQIHDAFLRGRMIVR